jgi:glutathione peroxidase
LASIPAVAAGNGFCILAETIIHRAMNILSLSTLAAAITLGTSLLAGEAKILSIPLKDIDGKPTSLKAFEGKVILAVNVASQCGNTPQYSGLQALHEKYKDKGLVVVGFPCNDFGAQEPGTNGQIKQFCSSNYQVTFPLMDKIHVKGPEQHPLYSELTGPGSPFPGNVKWNFGKFLIGRDGRVLARFEPGTEPDDAQVIKAIETALAKK